MQRCWDHWIPTCKSMNLDLYSQYTQIYSKGIKDLNVRAKSTRLLKKTGINLYDLELGNGFFDMIPKAQATEVKIRFMKFIKIKTFCASKNTKKRQLTEWEKISYI